MKKGFTLLEVIVAASIFGIGIISLVNLFSSSLKMTRQAADKIVIAQKVRSQDSVLRVREYSDLIGKNYLFQDDVQTYITPVNSEKNNHLLRVNYNAEFKSGEKENFVTYMTSP